MQWPGFKSLRLAQTDFDRALARDLLKFEKYVVEVAVRVARFVEAEPISDVTSLPASADATYVTLSANSELTNERVLSAGTGMAVVDGGAGGSVTLNLGNTAVTPGSYTYASLTVNAQGRLTAASTGAAPAALASTTPADVDLSAAAVGVGTTAARADHKHDLAENIAPTWTGLHTFNAGINLGTAGDIDCTTSLDFNLGGNQEMRLAANSMLLRDGMAVTMTGTTTGLSIGASGDKLGVYAVTPVARATTGVGAATFVANTSGIADDTATFDSYTIGQVVKALRNFGILT